ncbi:MAG: hypothetical protein R3E79_22175 [Caldilineaceae bacterium]
MQTEQVSPVNLEADTSAPRLSATEQQAAQKRVAIGLSPRRPTARATVQRPPRALFGPGQQWLLVGLVTALMMATVLLIIAKVTGAPTTWPQVRMQLAALLLGQSASTAPARAPTYPLRLEESFTTETGVLAGNQQPGQWTLAVMADQGVYQFQLWPGRLAWSTLALDDLSTYWLEASFTIADLMPDGYTGFLGRYQDAENFYLFVIDGTGHYQVLRWQDGALTTLQPWNSSPVLNQAGYENLLALADDGQTLRFYANDQLLFTVEAPVLPAGATGLVGGAGERTMAKISVDWLRLYAPAPQR